MSIELGAVKNSLNAALDAWTRCLGLARVMRQPMDLRRYGLGTGTTRQDICAALLPQTPQEVVEIVKIAAQFRIAIYPISTGRNWGYGDAHPASPACAIVDLSRLNRIVDFDPESGLATLEPGVTQQQLADYLEHNNYRFMVPTTGAGPGCSIVGNALERGYGITPVADHFAAVMSLEAVLPDGFNAFFFSAAEDSALESLVEATQKIMARLPGIVGSINLMNQHRVLAMTTSYPDALAARNGLLPADVIARLGRENQVMAWTGAGALYGEKEVVAAAQRLVRRLLAPVTHRLLFMTPAKTKFARHIAGMIPGQIGQRLRRAACALDGSLQLMLGRPSEVALHLAYWKMGGAPADRSSLDPARDGCGLIWYPPLVPMRRHAVRKYVTHVADTCIAHGIEPLITLTALSDRCFDSTVPLLFNQASEMEAVAAENCYHALFEDGLKLGFIPYRLGPQSMRRMADADDSNYWAMVAKLKAAIDPSGILAPGRYAPWHQERP